MSSQHHLPTDGGGHELDDVEKGLYGRIQSLATLRSVDDPDRKTAIHIETILPPMSPIHEGITPSASSPNLVQTWRTVGHVNTLAPDPAANPQPPPKPRISRWILLRLWFNTYRRFFTFVTLLNLTGIIMAALNRFPYAEKHLGALVLGNLLVAILMRNELFLRVLYIIAIYGLRSVR